MVSLDVVRGEELLTTFASLQECARYYEGYRKWKAEYEELKDWVKVLEKRVEEEKKTVLKRYRG